MNPDLTNSFIHKKKTIFVAVTHGWHARLLLRSSFLQTLLKDKKYLVVLLSPSADEKYFRESFGEHCELQKIQPQSIKLWNRLNFIHRYSLLDSKPTETHQLIVKAMLRYSWKQYFIIKLLNFCCKNRPWVANLFRKADRFLFPDREFGNLFSKFKPDLLVVCSIVHNEAFHLLRRAKKEGVPTQFIMESWDNPTAKMGLFEFPEHFLVWNKIMRNELIQFHHIPPDSITETGSAYHDVYADSDLFCDRSTLATRYGMNPKVKWIVVAATLNDLYPEFDKFMEQLEQARVDGSLGQDCQILIRPHPQAIARYSEGHGVEELEEIRKKYSSIFYDAPKVISQELAVDVVSEDILRLAEILFHADVVISFFSTVTIDACALDKPVILPAFDDYASKTWFPTMRQRLRFNHHQNVVRSGGVKIAHDFDELIEHIHNYLVHPEMDRQGRERIVHEQCYRLDGKSGERMANCICDSLSELNIP